MEAIVVLITTATVAEAEKIGEMLVEKRLAACVNILPPIKSVFHWGGKINHENEILLIAKSQKKHFEKLQQLVLANHSYEVPEIIALPIVAGLPDYLRWIETETRPNA